MILRHLTLAELAAELGRSPDWLYRHWRDLVAKKKLPKPLSGFEDGPLAWSAAQVYAYLDRDLPAHLKCVVAAYRAAAAAYDASHADPDEAVTLAAARARLDARFSPRPAPARFDDADNSRGESLADTIARS